MQIFSSGPVLQIGYLVRNRFYEIYGKCYKFIFKTLCKESFERVQKANSGSEVGK